MQALAGKTAIVTGAGRATALAAAKAVAIGSDQAELTSGQVISLRNNETYLFSHNRSIHTAQSGRERTPKTVLARVLPRFENDCYPLHCSGELFTWNQRLIRGRHGN